MKLLQLLLLILVGYYIIRFVKKIFELSGANPQVRGQAKKNAQPDKKKNIEDADFEEIE